GASQARYCPGGDRRRPADGGAGWQHRERGVATHPAGAGVLRVRAGVGGHRVRGHLRRPAAARRARGRPARPPGSAHRRVGAVFGGVAGRRVRDLRSVAAGTPGVQGAGGAIIAPTALALITTTFPEGRPRNRAMAVYSAMSGAGLAIGLIGGGLLTNYLSWRWVMFVNVPIGLLTALAAPRVLAESERRRGRF